MTGHAYRSWAEDHPKGYVQRDEGLKESNPRLAQWRAKHARHEPVRFEPQVQKIIAQVVVEIAEERCVRLHAVSVTRTHVHVLLSFRSPACTCGALAHCRKNCAARKVAESVFIRMKRKIGQAAAKVKSTVGRRWLSRGRDLTPVRNRAHFDYLIRTYLPKHATVEGGIVRVYQ